MDDALVLLGKRYEVLEEPPVATPPDGSLGDFYSHCQNDSAAVVGRRMLKPLVSVRYLAQPPFSLSETK